MRKPLFSLLALALILSGLVYIPAIIASPKIADGPSYSQSPAAADIPATIDFDPDHLNPTSQGKFVTVYIELPQGYDVNKINVSTVKLNGTVPAQAKPTEIGDYDKDNIPDLMVKFDREAVQQLLPQGDRVKVTVSGKVNGTTFEGYDYIRVSKGYGYGHQ